MREYYTRFFWLRWIIVLLVCVLQYGCQKHIPVETWDCVRMREIEKEWKSLWDSYRKEPEKFAGDNGKDKYETAARIADQLFEKRLSFGDLRRLAASCDKLPLRTKDRNEFTNDLLRFIISKLLESGDRESLIKLLSSTCCPSRIGPCYNIEFSLFVFGKSMKDPILIFEEAYSKCQNPAVQRDIAGAVRRGFAGYGIQGKDDAEFIKNAMSWYEKEKNHLIVNKMYWRNEVHVPLEEYEEHPEYFEKLLKSFRPEPLFLDTSAKK
jgi:hypothetical protein